MTAVQRAAPPTLGGLRAAIEAAAREIDELFDSAEVDAIAWHYLNLLPAKKAFAELMDEMVRMLAEAAPWSGRMWEPEGLPVLQLHQGKERKSFRWDELRGYLERTVLDPEGSGGRPAPEVAEAVEEAFSLLFAVAPLTGSTSPRVRALRPVLEVFGREVDEFCEVKPGRWSIEVHGEVQ